MVYSLLVLFFVPALRVEGCGLELSGRKVYEVNICMYICIYMYIYVYICIEMYISVYIWLGFVRIRSGNR